MKRLVACSLSSVLFLLACCPCNQVSSQIQRKPHERHFSHGYVPKALDSLILFDAWDGMNCLALNNFFQLWEDQSRIAIAETAAPDDTMRAVYELFEVLFSQSTDSGKSKYVAVQESVAVAVVDSSAFDVIRALSDESMYDFRSRYGRAHPFRYPLNLGKPILIGFPEYHHALNFLFLEDDKRRLSDVKDLDWDVVFLKSTLLEPYLLVRPNHWGIIMLTQSDPTMPSVIINEELSRALVEFRSWGCGGTWEYTRQDSIWVKSRVTDFWIE